MIRTNLSTRPFYNERAVHAWLLVTALIVAAFTAFNVERGMRYQRSDTQLVQQASRDEARAADLHRQANKLRATVDPRQVETASTAARQANDLIDRRTFSWTELLNRFETTLPDEVRITAIRPKIDRERGILLSVNVIARSVEDVNEFMENLEQTGAFRNINAATERVNDEGQLESQIEAGYTPGNAPPAAAAAAAKPPAAPATPAPTAPGAERP